MALANLFRGQIALHVADIATAEGGHDAGPQGAESSLDP